jgi:cysteine desulfurase
MSNDTIKSMFAWVNKGNPSSSYSSAVDSKKLMDNFTKYIANVCNIALPNDDDVKSVKGDDAKDAKGVKGDDAKGDDAKGVKSTKVSPSQYRVIFTSGASESNNTIIRSVVSAYKHSTATTPHIIISAIEHKSIMICCEDLAAQGLLSYTIVEPDELGFILPERVESAILPNTALVCIMCANNETGAINDYRKIGAIAHKNQIPYYTDSVQMFGKYPINPVKDNVDAFSVSFHKLYGPSGIGLLVVKEQFIRGYKLKSIISGTQNGGFRGGTENVMLYAGAFSGMRENFTARDGKNKKLLLIKRRIMSELSTYIPCKTYREYLESREDKMKNSAEVIFISTATKDYLPNTILLTLVKRTQPFLCNVDFKKDLESNGIIVSIGSACNTSSASASHVIHAMKVDSLLRKGMLRISLGDTNTEEEASRFVKIFLQVAKKHLAKVT